MTDKEIDIDAFRERLEAERDALRASSATRAADRAPVTLDQQSVGRLSRVDALQAQAMAQAQEERRRNRLRLIDAALRRIDDGEYGYCAKCGDEIGVRRLETDPAVARCVTCAG